MALAEMLRAPSSRRAWRWPNPHELVVAGVFFLLVLPLAATLLYALARQWGATVLPDALTLHWFVTLWQTPRFLEAFAHSLLVTGGAIALSLVLILPVALLVHTRYQRLAGWMNLLILMPFAVPPVVSSVGLLQLYSGGPLALVGTPWILLPTYFTIALPFMYRAISASLQAIDVRTLMEAAALSGAGPWQTFFRIILPNIRKGVMIGVFLSFSFLIGEFVFANLLVGTRYETLQVYLNNMRNESAHYTSALVITYFLFTLVLTWLGHRQHLSREPTP